jgi:catechol 2,3-dioxygenase-like lactoylglutathione lyase family enzyme
MKRLAALPVLALVGSTAPGVRPAHPGTVTLTTVAYRVHHMTAMVAFYTDAFGARFREVDARGIRSQFGQIGSLTIKFVPIRDRADFEGFPVHQPGFEVPEVARVIAAAERHGGRVENAPERQGGRVQAAVRDPDGNTIEVYGPR